jgi:hypothetical protein
MAYVVNTRQKSPVGQRTASFLGMLLLEVQLKEVIELLATIGAIEDGVGNVELAVA